jgi:hypothetical protein
MWGEVGRARRIDGEIVSKRYIERDKRTHM